MAVSHTRISGVNSYYLIANASLALAAIFILPLGNSLWGLGAYLAGGLAVVLALLGRAHPKQRTPAQKAAPIVQATSIIYLILGALVLWVALSSKFGLPKLPVLTDLDFVNYLVGWPVVEAVIIGSLINSRYRLTKPSWLAYTGTALVAVGLVLWLW